MVKIKTEKDLDNIIKNNKIIPKSLPFDLKYKIYKKVCKIKLIINKVEKIKHQNYLDDNNLIECDDCKRIWDGNAQCPCWLDRC